MVPTLVVTVRFATLACVTSRAVAGNVTVTALDQPAQQPRVRRDATRAQPPVLVADLADAIEHVTVDDRWHRDRDPLLARALAGPSLAAADGTVDPLVTVVVDRADVRLVSQQPVERRGAPLRLA